MRKFHFASMLLIGFLLSGCGLSGTAVPDQTIDVGCAPSELITALMGIRDDPPAGSAIINLAPNCEYVFDDPSAGDDGISALPTIFTNVIINGNQATLKLLKQIEDPPLRAFSVEENGSLSLNHLTFLTENTSPFSPQRDNAEWGGAIYSQGSLSVNTVNFSDNFAAVGGAIYSSGSLSVQSSHFEGNQADDGGGAIYSEGTTQIDDSIFFENASKFSAYGGAVYQVASDLRLNNCEFTSNAARGSHAHGGGAIGQIGGTMTVTGSLFDSNRHYRYGLLPSMNQPNNTGGGAIYLTGVAFTVTSSDFLNNDSNHQGGAISSSDEDWTYGFDLDSASVILEDPSEGKYPNANAAIENCVFSNNQAGIRSGAIHNQMGPMTISHTEFSGNWSDTEVGAIYHGGDSLSISHATFDGNQSLGGFPVILVDGNGDLDQGGPLSVSYSSFTNNQVLGSWPMIQAIGGGRIEIQKCLFAHNDAPFGTISTTWALELSIENSTFSHNSGPIISHGSLDLISSTIAQNTSAGIVYEPTWGSPEMTAMNSVVAGNAGGDCVLQGGINAVGANLDSDGSCSGFSLTADPLLEPLADNGGQSLTHALQADSPAIGAGNSMCPATDQRDVARPPVNCDLGAYEDTEVVDLATEPGAAETPIPEEVDRCALFDPSAITITLMSIPPGTTWQTLHLKIPGGVPGLEIEIPGDNNPWVYTAQLGLTTAEYCRYEGYPGRLYCSFELPESALGSSLPLSAFVNGCDSPFFTHPGVSIFDPGVLPVCSADLAENECVEAGGVYKDEVGSAAPYCECP